MDEMTIAQVCHEANRVLQSYLEEAQNPPWDEAPDWMKESTLDGVRNILNGTVITPEESHANWFNHREETGWRWGEVKDEVAKTHPLMVRYDELPVEQRAKDTLFFAIVKALG